ncbi:MAG TPA: FHA domain-containing protein [Terrimesophilobacter sp.]|nr:FHA domain-containing protein [Terrimesophilobacter sp.]HRQ00358.1 FHA domain-containing protein [Terrimesophilobacter sp.]
MSELTLLVLKFGFLLLLWVFIFAIIYALRSDLFGQAIRRPQTETPAGSFPSTPLPTPVTELKGEGSKNAKRLVITTGAKSGLEIDLTDQPLTIGRSRENGLVIRDDYTSTHHAKLLLWDDGWVIQDLDSTNGTFLDDERVTVPTPVPLGATVRIGTTSFELRR